jgi:hypothetical protein
MSTRVEERGCPAVVATPKPGLSARGPVVFVWGVWAVMLLVVLACIGLYGRNVPLAEDWLLVPPLTGHEPDMTTWLWAQNNEHRIPLPKLILLLLLKVTGGDFRVGMVLNTSMLATLALAMMGVARRLRGGTTSYADAFFPIALLHLGNWDNLIWSWQLQFVVSMTLTCVLLLVIVQQQALLTARAAIIAGICLILLPLCGANGLMFVSALALWFGYSGCLQWRLAEPTKARRSAGLFLLGSVATAILLTGTYFIGYAHPSWYPPSPSIVETLKTSAKFLALSFGPAAGKSWPLSILAVTGVLLLSVAVLVAGTLRAQGAERRRALGLLLFLSGIAVLALGVGWGRAAQVPTVGMPSRYVLLAVPTLCVVYFIWELYGQPFWRNLVQMSLFIGMCILLPLNTQAGFQWRDWYRQGMDDFERDLIAGTPRSVLAEHHREFLLHWDQEGLASGMQMLHEAGIGPFRQLREDAALDGEHALIGPQVISDP